MSEHIHDWKKSDRIHKRKGFFFVYCDCNPEKELQATMSSGYLCVFTTDPTKNRADDERATEMVSARITSSVKKRLKKSNYSTAKIIEFGLDYLEHCNTIAV